MVKTSEKYYKNLEQLAAAIVDPSFVLAQEWVTPFDPFSDIVIDPEDEECALQQNGIDLRLAEARVAVGNSRFTLNKQDDNRCDYHPLVPDQSNIFTFQAGKQYAVDFMEWIDIPANMSAYIIMRSSFNRYSGILLSAWWDSGFRGRLGCIYRPFVDTTVEFGVRMAQVVFIRSDSCRLYEGQYKDSTSQV